MKTTKLLVALPGLLLLASCTPSLQPLFTEKDLVFDPALVGQWSERSADKFKEAIICSKSGAKSYEVVYIEEKKLTRLEAHVLQLGRYRYLDLYPGEGSDDYLVIPAHNFARITLKGDELRIALLNEDWTSKMAASNRLAVPYSQFGKTLLLTAPTPDLQSLVLKNADDPQMFSLESYWVREQQQEDGR